jgi:hypothetical protein
VPGLKDIARRLRRTVTIAGEEVSVRGLTGDEMAVLLADYPEMGKVLSGAFDRMDPSALTEQAPRCIATMIALGTSLNGHAPAEEDIADARALPGAAALDLLAAIAEMSLPRAVVRPFVALVLDGDGQASADTGRGQDTR